ncbi:hypothetical protein JCM6882_004872 [Rhodosporidiobolus microsporus]
MPASPASSASDYGSELDWNDAAETQLAAFELTASSAAPPPSANIDQDATASLAVAVEHAAADSTTTSKGSTLTAARLAEALKEFGVATEDQRRDDRSLWERFRQRRGWGGLSVSDLSGPSWCEVQHTYRLASKPYLPPLERPATIVTSSGASIAIDTSRTVKREAVLDKGKAVHSKIEREVMGPQEKVEVEIAGKEEWWALRIVNLLVCLETLLDTGRVREVPVVGWIRGFLVFGVIDDIERRDFPNASSPPRPQSSDAPSASAPSAPQTAPLADPYKPPSSAPKRQGKTASATPEKDTQRSLTDFFSPVPSPSKKGKEKALDQDEVLDLTTEEDDALPSEVASQEPRSSRATTRVGFVLSDTKTRFNRSLPAKPESRAARLQLMLYRRLFTSLLQPEPPPPSPSSSTPPLSANSPAPFSWSRLCAHLSLDPSLPLSPAFLHSIAPILAGSNLSASLGDATTLGAFVDVLGRYGEMMRGVRAPEGLLEEEMEISYRLREAGGWRGRRSARGKGRGGGRKPRTGKRGGKQASTVDPAAAAAEADDEQDLQRAIQLSLQDAAETMKQDDPIVQAPASTLAPAGQPAAADTAEEPETLDSQLEDSQLPFLANPSLPLPVSDPPAFDESASFPPSSLPSTAQAFHLPLNSQTSTSAPPPPATHSSRSSRYNLRRRPAPSSPEVSTSLPSRAGESHRLATPSPPRKRPRSASPPSIVDAEGPPLPPVLAPLSSPSASSSLSTPPSSADHSTTDPSFIGTETFLNDPLELDAWLASVTAYWRGEREPVGVSLTEVNRCRTCEFEDGCEWRAMKAQEAVEQARARRMQGNKAG